ncbi:Uncharacterised protein [Acinetobacter baumannii]|nr:Uncharacterised protein [Acinetobacter baumannii]
MRWKKGRPVQAREPACATALAIVGGDAVSQGVPALQKASVRHE